MAQVVYKVLLNYSLKTAHIWLFMPSAVYLWLCVKAELKRMESMGVILVKQIDEPTEWVSSMVAVTKKDGSLCICIDPKNLNENRMHEHYQLLTIEDS